MITDSQTELEKIFMSYDRVLYKLNLIGIKTKISKEGIEWLCKNCFKHKYLELLEKYKMELTEIYIEKGYPYDVFLYIKFCILHNFNKIA